MANCPKCKSALSLVKDSETGKPTRIRCTKQKTEKKGNEFIETGECDFRVAFKTKIYSIDIEQMKKLVANEKVEFKGGSIELDLTNSFFTKVTLKDKYTEEEF
jgi:hypothetical protein